MTLLLLLMPVPASWLCARTVWCADAATETPASLTSAVPGGDSDADAAAVPKDDAATLGCMLGLTSTNPQIRANTLKALAGTRDLRLIPFLDDFAKGNAYLWQGRVVVAPVAKRNQQGDYMAVPLDPLRRSPLTALDHSTGTPGEVPLHDLKEVSASRKERSIVRDCLIYLHLNDPDIDQRLAAIQKSADGPSASTLTALELCTKTEPSPRVQRALRESIAVMQLTVEDAAITVDTRIAAAARLGEIGSARSVPHLQALIDTQGVDQKLVAAAKHAVERIERWQTFARLTGFLFAGLSLGSVLVLMALGLSIVFGLMGVINMAHGEMMMIGAYATYLTQQLFVNHLPMSGHDWYFPLAIPVAFVISAGFGVLIEWAIIRHLYGRPLETLLATWGVSLILIQTVRCTFGDNIHVNSPHYLQGGLEIATDITLPFARLFIMLFTCICIVAVSLLISRTRLGLLLRATTQNRTMAATLGVATRRIDATTFALGSGVAGMAGCALTLIGGVTPDMGQNYIVDSFLVVVTGGVGKLAGAIWAGLGLGVLNKIFEPFFEAVWAKVLILVVVIVFIQRRPSGLFPAKGRMADV